MARAIVAIPVNCVAKRCRGPCRGPRTSSAAAAPAAPSTSISDWSCWRVCQWRGNTRPALGMSIAVSFIANRSSAARVDPRTSFSPAARRVLFNGVADCSACSAGRWRGREARRGQRSSSACAPGAPARPAAALVRHSLLRRAVCCSTASLTVVPVAPGGGAVREARRGQRSASARAPGAPAVPAATLVRLRRLLRHRRPSATDLAVGSNNRGRGEQPIAAQRSASSASAPRAAARPAILVRRARLQCGPWPPWAHLTGEAVMSRRGAHVHRASTSRSFTLTGERSMGGETRDASWALPVRCRRLRLRSHGSRCFRTSLTFPPAGGRAMHGAGSHPLQHRARLSEASSAGRKTLGLSKTLPVRCGRPGLGMRGPRRLRMRGPRCLPARLTLSPARRRCRARKEDRRPLRHGGLRRLKQAQQAWARPSTLPVRRGRLRLVAHGRCRVSTSLTFGPARGQRGELAERVSVCQAGRCP